MSLILEALRKLERDRQAAEPGVLVVAHRDWPEGRRGRLPMWLGAATVLTATALLFGWWLQRERAPRTQPAATEGRAALGPPASTPQLEPAPATSATQEQAPLPALPASAVVSATTLPAAEPVRVIAPAPVVSETEAPTVRTPPTPASPRDETPAHPVTETGAAAPPQAQRFVLQAIGVRDGRPVAMLNDRLVREGDAFDGIRVLRVGTTEIEIEVDGERRVVRF